MVKSSAFAYRSTDYNYKNSLQFIYIEKFSGKLKDLFIYFFKDLFCINRSDREISEVGVG